MKRELKAFLKRKDFKASMLLSGFLLIAALVAFAQWTALFWLTVLICTGACVYIDVKFTIKGGH